MNSTATIDRTRRDRPLCRVMPDGTTMPIAAPGPLAPLSEAAAHAAAPSDPDAQPLTDAALTRMRRVPRTTTLRRALGLTQQQFAARFQIPLGTLRDWEQGRAQPDQTARAYLKAIAGDAAAVHRALQAESREP